MVRERGVLWIQKKNIAAFDAEWKGGVSRKSIQAQGLGIFFFLPPKLKLDKKKMSRAGIEPSS